MNETANGAYQILVDAGTILYFIPFLYMYAAAIKLAYRARSRQNANAALIPGGKFGVWIAALLGFAVVTGGIVLSLIPPAEVTQCVALRGEACQRDAWRFLLGLVLYFRGARAKAREAARRRRIGESRARK